MNVVVGAGESATRGTSLRWVNEGAEKAMGAVGAVGEEGAVGRAGARVGAMGFVGCRGL